MPRKLKTVATLGALGLLSALAGCHGLARRLPAYRAHVLALGPATAVAWAPDGSWLVAARGTSWRILSDDSTASWPLGMKSSDANLGRMPPERPRHRRR